MLTVEPPTNTGSSTANGVVRPVRPTETMMSRKIVVRSSGGNLNAMAQRGARDVLPNFSRCASESTLMTTPSISYGSVCRFSCQFLQNATTPARSSTTLIFGFTGKPRSWRYFKLAA